MTPSGLITKVLEVGIGGHRVNLDAQLLKFGIVVRQIFQFGRADEGESAG